MSQLYAVRKAIRLLHARNENPRCSHLGSKDDRNRSIPRPPPMFKAEHIPRIASPQRLLGNGNPIKGPASGLELVPEFNESARHAARYAKIEAYNKTFKVRCLRCWLVSKRRLKFSEEDPNVHIPLRHNKHCFLKNEVILDPSNM